MSVCLCRAEAPAHVPLIPASAGLKSPALLRFDAEDRTFLFVRQHIQEAVRPLPHVADALPQVGQQRLAPQLLHLLVEQDPFDVAGAWDLARAQRADEDIALPLGQLVAGVEGHARHGNGRRPVDERILDAVLAEFLRLPRSGIGAAETDDRPAVVATGTDDVDLVAAVRTVFVLPELSGCRMNRQAERIAMSD